MVEEGGGVDVASGSGTEEVRRRPSPQLQCASSVGSRRVGRRSSPRTCRVRFWVIAHVALDPLGSRAAICDRLHAASGQDRSGANASIGLSAESRPTSWIPRHGRGRDLRQQQARPSRPRLTNRGQDRECRAGLVTARSKPAERPAAPLGLEWGRAKGRGSRCDLSRCQPRTGCDSL